MMTMITLQLSWCVCDQTDVALLFDAMYVLAYGLDEALEHMKLSTANISCDGDQAWAYGSAFYSHLNLVRIIAILYVYRPIVLFCSGATTHGQIWALPGLYLTVCPSLQLKAVYFRTDCFMYTFD